MVRTALAGELRLAGRSGDASAAPSPPSVTSLFIRGEELGLGQDVPFHGVLEVGLACVLQGEHGVERVQLEEVAVPANRRTRAAVGVLLPIVDTLNGADRHRVRSNPLRQRAGAGRQVV